MLSDPPLVTFVDPGPLNWVTRACLKSAVRVGHSVHAYAYGEISDLPRGVTAKDANEVTPKADIFLFDGVTQPEQSGSLAPFSDALRYRLLSLGLGTWVDWDVYFLHALDPDQTTILGWEGPRPFGASLNPYAAMVGNAIMRMPPDSRVLQDLVRITSAPYEMPPWLSPWLRYQVKRNLGGAPYNPGAARYAEYGPIALSYFIRKHRMKSSVRNYTYHYPVDYREVSAFLQEANAFLASLPREAQTIHLWNSSFRRLTNTSLPPNSFAARLREESLDA